MVESVSTKKHIRVAPALSLNSRQRTSVAGGGDVIDTFYYQCFRGGQFGDFKVPNSE